MKLGAQGGRNYPPYDQPVESTAVAGPSDDSLDALATILADEVPLEHVAQCQTGLLVSGRDWIDFTSYNGGMPLWRKRVEPDEKWHAAIKEAVSELEMTANEMVPRYNAITADLPQTERIDLFPEMEIF